MSEGLAHPALTQRGWRAASAVPARHPLITFTVLVVGSAVLLQRFGIPIGGKATNLVGPLCLLLALWHVARGTLVFSRVRLCCFMLALAWAAAGLAYNYAVPAPFAATPSLQSTAQFFAMTGFATLAFYEPVSETAFFRAVTGCLVVVAVAGIGQFAAQFAGLSLFSFRGFVPERLLFEDGWNLTIPFGVGALLKSNGFFMLEPSIFSQFMAMGIAIEVLTTRRSHVLALFVAGLLVSGAGTGWLVLATFVASVTFSLGLRGIALAVATAALVIVAAGTASLLAPDIAGSLQNRMGEFSQPGTSGHLRFVTPFWALSDVLGRAPMALVFGLGGGVSERLVLPYEFDLNTPVKTTLEYGLPVFVFYLGTVVLGLKSPVQRALCAPALVMLMITGAYQQFPPVLFFVLLVISIARLNPDPAPSP